MSGGGGASERSLDQTPTWAVALTFERKRKRALYEALQKIKGELMVLGFISLLLTFGQNYIAKICIPASAANTMLPCPAKYATHEHGGGHEDEGGHEEGHHRRLLWSVCKTDYLAMRHGFVTVHLAPGSNFNFQKYIKRSMEDDFKVVVGINAVFADECEWMAINVMAIYTTFHLVGTKLQAIITQMALEIEERHAVVQGIPLVQVSDRYFWFSKPKLVLHLIHLTLFQYEFGSDSCFHESFHLAMARVAFGIAVQFMCSYITLPLYALVTQMGSSMKQSIFDEQTSKALMKWRNKAKHKNHHHHHVTREHGSIKVRKLGGSKSSGHLPDAAAAGKSSSIDDDVSSASGHTIEIHEDHQEGNNDDHSNVVVDDDDNGNSMPTNNNTSLIDS
nr:MLO-like protein 9 [Ipomoea batatas]